MYIQESLARDRQAERLKQAQDGQVAHLIAELSKMKKRQERAERKLLSARKRVERLRSRLY